MSNKLLLSPNDLLILDVLLMGPIGSV